MKRFENESVVVRLPGPVYGQVVRMGGQIHDRCIHVPENLLCGLHSVLLAFQAYVHQNQIRAFLGGDRNAFICSVHGGDYEKTEARETLSEFFGDQSLVFNDQSTGARGIYSAGMMIHRKLQMGRGSRIVPDQLERTADLPG